MEIAVLEVISRSKITNNCSPCDVKMKKKVKVKENGLPELWARALPVGDWCGVWTLARITTIEAWLLVMQVPQNFDLRHSNPQIKVPGRGGGEVIFGKKLAGLQLLHSMNKQKE